MISAKDMLGETIHVRGTIRTITYKKVTKNDNYFGIFKMDCELISGRLPIELLGERNEGGRLLTFTGFAPEIRQGVEYEIVAELTDNERYGYQYKIIRMAEHLSFQSHEDLEKFFAYALPEGIAKKLLASLDDPIDVLERKDIAALTQVHGVGVKKATQIINRYEESRIDMEAYIELYDYGLTKNMLDKLLRHYGSANTLVKKIKENPYILIYEVSGVGWMKADQIALNGGLDPNDPRRMEAFIYYICMQDARVNGNTCMSVETLLEYCHQQFSEVAPNKIGMLIIELAKKGLIHIDKKTREIGLQRNYDNEEFIARELYRIANAPIKPISNIDAVIEACEREVGITYSDEQRKAIHACLTQNVSILTALGGSGKTSSMMPVARAIRENGQYAALCALSGKASSNLGEMTGLTGSTIHKLLGYNGEESAYDRSNPLPYNMIILDEASMVDEEVFKWLLEAIPNGCKLVMVGDTGQLEPIGVGCVFHDMINAKKFAHTHLTKIFRQAQKSGVISESRRVYDEEQIVKPNFIGTEIRGELQDFKITTTNSIESVLVETLKEYKRFLSEYKASPYDIAVVTGKRAIGDTSARKINECIQKIVNPNTYTHEASVTKKDGNVEYTICYKPGDKVRITKNNYETVNVEGEKTPIFNGNIGVILEIDGGYMTIRFQQGDVLVPWYIYEDMELGYAITCHSAQGSGFPYVIAVCDNGSYALLSKEWLYTAMTRCKKFCTLIGQPSAIRRACSITGIKYKQTWLKRMITNLWESQGETVEEKNEETDENV